MKSYKQFRRDCPSGYKFSSKLGACIPKGNRHVNVIGRYLGGRQNDDSDNNKKNGSNGNGNGNGGNGNGNGGSGKWRRWRIVLINNYKYCVQNETYT